MRRLWDAARFKDAAWLYDDESGKNPPLEATFLRARIYLKHDDAPAAIRLLERSPAGKGPLSARRAMLLGAAYAHGRNYSLADEFFDFADTTARRIKAPELICDIAFYRARRYAYERRPDAARELLPLARSYGSESAQLRALQLEGFILDQEGRHREEARILLELLRRIDPNGIEGMDIRAWATDTLAYLARETYLPEALPEVERQLAGIDWSPDLDDRRFQALKALGWACALRGDYFNALRYLRLCSRKATNDVGRAIAAAERAELLRCKGEQLWSRQELAEAEEYAENIDWTTVRDDARIGLLLLAELFVSIDPAKAAYYQARFSENEDVKAPNLHLKGDPRLAALAQYSEGVVDLSSGHRRVGVESLKKALETFRKHGYDWRAGRCALRLYEVTRDEAYMNLAHEHLRNYMSSWLGDEYRGLLSASPVRLPPMQQRVLEALCSGLTVPQIAQKFGRSQHTIRNHIKPVFKAYGVNNRTALIAKVAQGR